MDRPARGEAPLGAWAAKDQLTAHRLFHIERNKNANIVVDRVEGVYRAFIMIDEHQALLDRIYIFADESGIMPSVEYIELFSVDVETGEEVHEKYLP